MDSLTSRFSDYGQFLSANWSWLILFIIGMMIIIGSGAWAASIAEIRNRTPLLHLIIGCLLPVIYPTIILFTLPYAHHRKKKQRQGKEEKITRMEGAPPPEGPPIMAMGGQGGPEAITEEALGEEVMQYDQAYFKSMTYDEKGNYRGPFRFRVNDEQFKVERIINALDNVVVIENVDSDGKTQHLRIPYGRIESCTEIE